jgi:hypothetical protein
MNQLTRLLVKETLGEQKIIALYGGSFKPPTKGHFNVVKETLQKYPEIDELIVYVGSGERDGVTQEESVKIWEIYKNYLSPKVIIEPTISPIKTILDYSKINPEQKIYWVLGARECQESDFTDIACRTKSVTKYPNIEVKIITSSGGVSGTKTRQAVKTNDKQLFFNLIPDVNEKEEIWDIVKPVVKETKTRAQIIKEQIQKYKLQEKKELNIQDLAYQQIPGLLEKGINYGLAHFRAFIKSFYKWSGTKDKNEFFNFIESLNGEIKRVPLSSIIPSQKGEDYKNASSEYEAEEFKKILNGEKNVEDHRKEDFYPIVVNKRDNKIIDGNHRHYALSSINSPYAVILYIDVPEKYLQEVLNDPFELKSIIKEIFEDEQKDIDFKQHLKSLIKYMVKQGLNIKPLPKIIIISNDKQNASSILGKTAYYDPNNKSITLYTLGRHPKDVMRSFSHEMIHHIQNIEDRLNNIATTNTNEDGDLPEIEREAYEKGNMMFRNWEDSIKNV